MAASTHAAPPPQAAPPHRPHRASSRTCASARARCCHLARLDNVVSPLCPPPTPALRRRSYNL
eukprot:scaffold37466_cov59-Phaeocystis_antarctica.AAC.6